MIIPKHKVCDICCKPVGFNKRYYVIKSKDFISNTIDGFSDNKTHHICEDCMEELSNLIRKQRR